MAEKTYNCAYKMCDNLGIAIDPVKHKSKYYCKTCLEKMQKSTELRKKIMDTTLEIIPLEIPSLINKVVNQWTELGYPLEYIYYTVLYIKLNNCVLNHFHGVRYYMNKDEIKSTYDRMIKQRKLKEQENKEFETTDEQVEFKPIQTNKWSDLL